MANYTGGQILTFLQNWQDAEKAWKSQEEQWCQKEREWLYTEQERFNLKTPVNGKDMPWGKQELEWLEKEGSYQAVKKPKLEEIWNSLQTSDNHLLFSDLMKLQFERRQKHWTERQSQWLQKEMWYAGRKKLQDQINSDKDYGTRNDPVPDQYQTKTKGSSDDITEIGEFTEVEGEALVTDLEDRKDLYRQLKAIEKENANLKARENELLEQVAILRRKETAAQLQEKSWHVMENEWSQITATLKEQVKNLQEELMSREEEEWEDLEEEDLEEEVKGHSEKDLERLKAIENAKLKAREKARDKTKKAILRRKEIAAQLQEKKWHFMENKWSQIPATLKEQVKNLQEELVSRAGEEREWEDLEEETKGHSEKDLERLKAIENEIANLKARERARDKKKKAILQRKETAARLQEKSWHVMANEWSQITATLKEQVKNLQEELMSREEEEEWEDLEEEDLEEETKGHSEKDLEGLKAIENENANLKARKNVLEKEQAKNLQSEQEQESFRFQEIYLEEDDPLEGPSSAIDRKWFVPTRGYSIENQEPVSEISEVDGHLSEERGVEGEDRNYRLDKPNHWLPKEHEGLYEELETAKADVLTGKQTKQEKKRGGTFWRVIRSVFRGKGNQD